MNIDIADLSMRNILSYSDYFQSAGSKVLIYVYATELFLKENPCMANAVHTANSPGEDVKYCILNISDSAIRNLHREGIRMVFDTRFNGVEHRIFVVLGDIFGIGIPDSELILDPCVIMTSQASGRLMFRPYSSLEDDEAVKSMTSSEAPVETKRPTLTVVK